MNQTLAEFKADGADYCVVHNNDTDYRTVETPEGDVVVTIDSNLAFHRGGFVIGTISVNPDSGCFEFISFSADYIYVLTEIYSNGYDHRNILKAEIEIATKLIEHIGRTAQPEVVWSEDGEKFNYDSAEEILSDASVSRVLNPGDTVFYGDKTAIAPTDLVRAMHIIDQANESLGDMIEFPTELEPSQEALQELDGLITDWFKKHCPINYYRVENVKEHILTEQDFIDAGVEIGGNDE